MKQFLKDLHVYLEVKEIDVRVRTNINKIDLNKLRDLCRPKCTD